MTVPSREALATRHSTLDRYPDTKRKMTVQSREALATRHSTLDRYPGTKRKMTVPSREAFVPRTHKSGSWFLSIHSGASRTLKTSLVGWTLNPKPLKTSLVGWTLNPKPLKTSLVGWTLTPKPLKTSLVGWTLTPKPLKTSLVGWTLTPKPLKTSLVGWTLTPKPLNFQRAPLLSPEPCRLVPNALYPPYLSQVACAPLGSPSTLEAQPLGLNSEPLAGRMRAAWEPFNP
jgi:hypothetical protein